MDINMQKRFRNPCGQCRFLGQYEQYDLYLCELGKDGGFEPAVLALDDHDDDFIADCHPLNSLPPYHPELAEAVIRAIQRKLVLDPKKG